MNLVRCMTSQMMSTVAPTATNFTAIETSVSMVSLGALLVRPSASPLDAEGSAHSLGVYPTKNISTEAFSGSCAKTMIKVGQRLVRALAPGCFLIANDLRGNDVYVATEDYGKVHRVRESASFTAPLDVLLKLTVEPTDYVPEPSFWDLADAKYRLKTIEELSTSKAECVDRELSLLQGNKFPYRVLKGGVFEFQRCPAVLRVQVELSDDGSPLVFVAGFDEFSKRRAFHYQQNKWWELSTKGHATFFGLHESDIFALEGDMFCGTDVVPCEPMRCHMPREWMPAIEIAAPYDCIGDSEFNPEPMTQNQYIQCIKRRLEIEQRHPTIIAWDFTDPDLVPGLIAGALPFVVGTSEFPTAPAETCFDDLHDFPFFFDKNFQKWRMVIRASVLPVPVVAEAVERQVAERDLIFKIKAEMSSDAFMASEIALKEQIERELHEVQDPYVLKVQSCTLTDILTMRYSRPKHRRKSAIIGEHRVLEIAWPMLSMCSSSNKTFRGIVCGHVKKDGSHCCDKDMSIGTVATQHLSERIHLWNTVCEWPGLSYRAPPTQIEMRCADDEELTTPTVKLASCVASNFRDMMPHGYGCFPSVMIKEDKRTEILRDFQQLQMLAEGAIVPARGMTVAQADVPNDPFLDLSDLSDLKLSWADWTDITMPNKFYGPLRNAFYKVCADPEAYLTKIYTGVNNKCVKIDNATIIEALAHASGLAPLPIVPTRPSEICLFSGPNSRRAFNWAFEHGLLTDADPMPRALSPSTYVEAVRVGLGNEPAVAEPVVAEPIAVAIVPAALPTSGFVHDLQCRNGMSCSDPDCLLVHYPSFKPHHLCARERAGERCKIFHSGSRNHNKRGCPFGHKCQVKYVLPGGMMAVGFEEFMPTVQHFVGGLTAAGIAIRRF